MQLCGPSQHLSNWWFQGFAKKTLASYNLKPNLTNPLGNPSGAPITLSGIGGCVLFGLGSSGLGSKPSSEVRLLGYNFSEWLPPWPDYFCCSEMTSGGDTAATMQDGAAPNGGSNARPEDTNGIQSLALFLSAAEGQRHSNYLSCCSWIFCLIYVLSTSTTVLPPIFKIF